MLGGSQPYWYKDTIMEKRKTHIILNSLLYIHEICKYILGYSQEIRHFY